LLLKTQVTLRTLTKQRTSKIYYYTNFSEAAKKRMFDYWEPPSAGEPRRGKKILVKKRATSVDW
jgi:hypothetical protein